MSLCRRNSQKPNEELIQRFQKNFSDVVSPLSSMNAAAALGGNPQMGHHVPSSKYVLLKLFCNFDLFLRPWKDL